MVTVRTGGATFVGRSPTTKISVRSMARKPGQGAGQTVIFSPMENHPDWGLFSGVAPSPTIYDINDQSVRINRQITDWYAMMFSGYGLVTDVDMSFTIEYEGLGVSAESYLAAKGIDMNNFVGVTLYNGSIRLYQRVNGNWGDLGVMLPDTGIVGQTARMTIVGDQVSLYVDGNLIGTATTGLVGAGYLGIMIRNHPYADLMLSNMNFTGQKVSGDNVITHHGEVVTHHGFEVTYNG